ncbi:MAG: phosphatase PAP2 family protein [Deltaproteobacteria bacterium]|nr:phosphatase PAP2 family protein [Deltaproteobacteria bacterium]
MNILRKIFLIPPDFLFLTIFGLLLASIIVKYGGSLKWVDGSIVLPAIGASIVFIWTVLYKTIKNKLTSFFDIITVIKESAKVLRDWLPLILMILVYENLKDKTALMENKTIEWKLAEMDAAIFGGIQPTVWLEKYTHPVLVDIMAINYALYFILPLSVWFTLYLMKNQKGFYEVSTAMISTLYIGYIGYVIFPAAPPRFTLTYEAPLPSIFLHNFLQSQWDKAAAVMLGAFPSLHVGLSTLSIIFAYRYRRELPKGMLFFWVVTPLTVGLWFSTVYLRHHWVVDIFAGWLVAIMGSIISIFGVKFWLKNRNRLLKKEE